MLVRTTQSTTHETVNLQNSILTHKTDNVCRCYKIQERARDLCGYPKLLVSKQVVSFNLQKCLEHHSREAPSRRVKCTIICDQRVSGWELRAVIHKCHFQVRSALHSFIAVYVCDRRYALCVFIYVKTTLIILIRIRQRSRLRLHSARFFWPVFELQTFRSQ